MEEKGLGVPAEDLAERGCRWLSLVGEDLEEKGLGVPALLASV